jgi:type VI protein secretion system component VasK
MIFSSFLPGGAEEESRSPEDLSSAKVSQPSFILSDLCLKLLFPSQDLFEFSPWCRRRRRNGKLSIYLF